MSRNGLIRVPKSLIHDTDMMQLLTKHDEYFVCRAI